MIKNNKYVCISKNSEKDKFQLIKQKYDLQT